MRRFKDVGVHTRRVAIQYYTNKKQYGVIRQQRWRRRSGNVLSTHTYTRKYSCARARERPATTTCERRYNIYTRKNNNKNRYARFVSQKTNVYIHEILKKPWPNQRKGRGRESSVTRTQNVRRIYFVLKLFIRRPKNISSRLFLDVRISSNRVVD